MVNNFQFKTNYLENLNLKFLIVQKKKKPMPLAHF